MTFTEDIRDWQYEVANGDTVLGFMDWLKHREEAERIADKLGWSKRNLSDSKSPLVQLVEGYEQLQRLCTILGHRITP